MTLEQSKKLANHIFRLLKVTEITFPLGRTNKGNLGLKFTEGSNDFQIMLDAIPLPIKDSLNDENNIELKKMIEKYWFESNHVTNGYLQVTETPRMVVSPVKKKVGRPKKIV